VRRQIFGNPQPLLLASAALFVLAAFPGLPKLPFVLLGTGVGAMAWRMRQKAVTAEKMPAAQPKTQARENLETLLRVEPLAVEVGLGLVKLVEGGPNSPLLRRIAGIRRQLAAELGYILPPVRVTDNLSLRSREYLILLKGIEIARFELQPGCELAIPPAAAKPPEIQGLATREPAFGIPALWVRSEHVEAARTAGCTVVDAANVLGTHLAELARKHACELFSRQDAKKVLDRVAEEHPKVVEDLVPKLLPLAVVQKVMQNLLRERVPIRDALTILEALGEAAHVTRNPVLLTEYARQAMSRAVVKPHLNPAGELPAFFLDPALEQQIEAAVEHGEHSSHLTLAPQKIREIMDRLRRAQAGAESPGVVITSSAVRYFFRQIVEPVLPNLFVLSHNEIPPGATVASMGLI
jgi:flagellar biosynthesis protein FlhA